MFIIIAATPKKHKNSLPSRRCLQSTTLFSFCSTHLTELHCNIMLQIFGRFCSAFFVAALEARGKLLEDCDGPRHGGGKSKCRASSPQCLPSQKKEETRVTFDYIWLTPYGLKKYYSNGTAKRKWILALAH